MKIKSLFLSDLHLGVSENKVKEAVKILELYDFDNLFLVGDIIDIKELRKKWRWNFTSTEFLHKVIKLSNKVRVVYIVGNHERGFFDDLPDSGLPIHFCRHFVYDNKLVIHGDQFDMIIGNWKWVYSLGDFGYNLSIRLNYIVNKVRRLFGYGEYSLSKHLKKIVKKGVNYLSNFHLAAAKYAKYHKCDTVICGHTHMQESLLIDEVMYINCGDLRQDLNYLIEDLDGKLILKTFEEKDEH